MMSEASFASLGPTLLARKGGAKPAMRPQLTPLPDDLAALAALADEQLEDLGWNDMGADRDLDRVAERPAPLLSIKPAARTAPRATDAHEDQDEESGSARLPDGDHGPDHLGSAEIVAIGTQARSPDESAPQPATVPDVHDQRTLLESRFPADTATPEQVAGPRPKQGRRAAFTLRLDAERHLKLRLVSTMQGVSAQSLVTEALDALLAEIDGLDTLVERMKRD